MYRPSLFNSLLWLEQNTLPSPTQQERRFLHAGAPFSLNVRSGCHELFEKTAAERIENCKAKGAWRDSTDVAVATM